MITLTSKMLKEHFLFMFSKHVPSFKVKSGEEFVFTLSFDTNDDGEPDATWLSRSDFKVINPVEDAPFHYVDLDSILYRVRGSDKIWAKVGANITVTTKFKVDLGPNFHSNDYPKHIECKIVEVAFEETFTDSDVDFELF